MFQIFDIFNLKVYNFIISNMQFQKISVRRFPNTSRFEVHQFATIIFVNMLWDFFYFENISAIDEGSKISNLVECWQFPKMSKIRTESTPSTNKPFLTNNKP